MKTILLSVLLLCLSLTQASEARADVFDHPQCASAKRAHEACKKEKCVASDNTASCTNQKCADTWSEIEHSCQSGNDASVNEAFGE